MTKKQIEVWFQIEKDADGYPKTRDWEGLLCEPEGKHFIVKSVPFYVKGIAYGDRVSATKSKEGYFRFTAIKKRGGYSVFRLLAKDDPNKIIRDLLEKDFLVEKDGNLIAIATPPSISIDEVTEFVIAGRESGRWGAQEGHVHGNP